MFLTTKNAKKREKKRGEEKKMDSRLRGNDKETEKTWARRPGAMPALFAGM